MAVPTRRDFVQRLGAFVIALGYAAPRRYGGRLNARPHAPRKTITPGLVSLGLARSGDTQLYVPTGYRADHASTLILGLHGATQNSDFTLRILRDAAESNGHLLLAPNSRDVTWDIIHGDFGDDERLLDSALGWTFDRCNVDPARVVIAGFSDGASAALSLGLVNGDLFRRVAAFSPGFIVGDERHGKPSIFISHGTRDQILPIDQTSRRIVPALKRQGYPVVFHEFAGRHQVTPEVVTAMMEWLSSTS